MNKFILFLLLEGILSKVRKYTIDTIKYNNDKLTYKQRVEAARYLIMDSQYKEGALYSLFIFNSTIEGVNYWEEMAEKWRFFKLNYDPQKETLYRFLVYHGILYKWLKHFKKGMPFNEKLIELKKLGPEYHNFGGKFITPWSWHENNFFANYKELWYREVSSIQLELERRRKALNE